jgi:hypothetical protein
LLSLLLEFLFELIIELLFFPLLEIPEVDQLDLIIFVGAKVFNHSILRIILLLLKVRVNLTRVNLLRELGHILPRMIERPSLLRVSIRSIGELLLFSLWLRDGNHGVGVHLTRGWGWVVEVAEALLSVGLVLEDFLLGGFAAIAIEFLPAAEGLLLRLCSEGFSICSSSARWEVLIWAVGALNVGRVVLDLLFLKILKKFFVDLHLFIELADSILEILKCPLQIFDMLKILFVLIS